MNKTIQFALMMAVVAAVGIATTAVMSPISAHADQPRYCFNNGGGDKGCFTSQEQCERAADKDNQCRNNRG
jgi:hypothetical protein